MSKQAATPTRPIRTQSGRQTPTRSGSGTKKAQVAAVRPFQMPFEAKNIRLILVGVLVIALGYLLMYESPTMSVMAITISPFILLIGYCVIVPLGIMAGTRNAKSVPLVEQPTTNGAA